MLFSSIFYSSYSVYVFLHRKLFKSSTTTPTLLSLLLFPPAIYYLKKLVNYLFNCRIAQKQDRLKARQAELKARLEEIKVETQYYQTKDLIEKYDEQNKKEDSIPSKEKSMDNVTSKTTSTNKNTSMNDSMNTNTFKRKNQGIPDQRLLPPSNSPASPHTHTQILPPPYKSPNWMDRFMDALIGDDSRNQKYALICAQCFNHNGLAAPEQFDSVLKYRCPNCGFFNQQRMTRKRISSNDSDESTKDNSSVQIKEDDTPIKAPPHQNEHELKTRN